MVHVSWVSDQVSVFDFAQTQRRQRSFVSSLFALLHSSLTPHRTTLIDFSIARLRVSTRLNIESFCCFVASSISSVTVGAASDFDFISSHFSLSSLICSARCCLLICSFVALLQVTSIWLGSAQFVRFALVVVSIRFDPIDRCGC